MEQFSFKYDETNLKNDFYNRYNYLKPDCEKTKKELKAEKRAERWENFKNWCSGVAESAKNLIKNVGEWLKENWKSLLQVIAAIAVAIIIVVVAVATFGAAAVVLAAVIGAVVGVASQLVGDVVATVVNYAKTGEWSWQGSSWQEYVGAAIGGALGGIILLTGNGMAANMVASGFSTYFSGHLNNITGGEKKDSGAILCNTFYSVGVAALFTKVGDKAAKGLSKTFSNNTFIRRLAGQGSYEASFKMVLSKLANGTVKDITYRTFRNGIISGLFGNSFESIFNGAFKIDFSEILKSIILVPVLNPVH